MTLDEFLVKYKDTVKAVDLAQAISRTDGYVSKLRRFQFIPSLRIILRICEFSNHQISPQELVEDHNMKLMFYKMCKNGVNKPCKF
jgi:hypothetical protein